MELTPELQKILEDDGYRYLQEIDGIICGLYPFMFTIGLMVNITMESYGDKKLPGYEYRYCYPHEKAGHALLDLKLYKYGVDPEGEWIKQKGSGIDRTNPKLKNF